MDEKQIQIFDEIFGALDGALDQDDADGYNTGRTTVNQWWTTPVTVPTTNPTITWETPGKFDPYKITCDAHNDL